MKTKQYQPKTGAKCSCKPGQQRDNCPTCEGTGLIVDFKAIRAAKTTPEAPQGSSGSYRTPDGKAQIEWKLEQKENGLEFSASGTFDGSAGQNIDTIAAAYPQDAMVQRIFKVWADYHLNGLNAGIPRQEAYLRQRAIEFPDDIKNAPYNGDHYKWACGVLKAADLLDVELSKEEEQTLKATGGFEKRYHPQSHRLLYTYGTRWVFSEIPAEVIAEIKSWSSNASESHYDFTAQKFLDDHGIKFRATLSDSKPAAWQPAGHHYRVTLSRSSPKVAHGRPWPKANGQAARLTFDFWDSVANAEAGIETLKPYAVLSSINSDIGCPETFEDFCGEYGYEADSIKALQTFKRASAHASRLRGFFTADEQEALQTIR